MAATRKVLTSLHGKQVGLAQGGDLIVKGRVTQTSDDGGTKFSVQGTPTAVNSSATLTIAQILTGIITSTTAAAVSAALPTGTLTDAGQVPALAINDCFEWTVINTGAANAFTITAGTDHTIVGSAIVALSSSATFRTRKTAANTYVTYRV